MKTIYLFLFILVVTYSLPAQVVNIPDPVFKAILLSANESNNIATDDDFNPITIDVNQNNEIELTEVLFVKSLGIANDNLNALTGIEAFSNLKTLWLDSSSLTSLGEVQQMMNLEYLEIDCNSITSIELQQMHSLNYLKVGINTPITEIDLCGTSVFSLWCLSHPTLQSINFKNNIVSGINIGDMQRFPPPLPNIWLENAVALQNVCYDEGEYPAIVSTLNSQLIPNITFTTNCDSGCMLAQEQYVQNPLTVWPNPVESLLHINIPKNTEIHSVNVYNFMGQFIKKCFTDELSPFSVDVTDLKTGTYFLEIISNQKKVTQKFIKL